MVRNDLILVCQRCIGDVVGTHPIYKHQWYIKSSLESSRYEPWMGELIYFQGVVDVVGSRWYTLSINDTFEGKLGQDYDVPSGC